MMSLRSYIFFLLIVFCFIGGLRSQNRKVDSLQKVLKEPGKDSARVTALYQLFQYHIERGKIRTADSIYIQLKQLAEKYDYKEFTGIAVLAKAIFYKETHDYPNCQKYLSYALLDLNEETQPVLYADAAAYMGLMQEMMGDHDKALSYHKLALKVRLKLADENIAVFSYLRMGVCYGALKQNDSAHAIYYKGIIIAERNRSNAMPKLYTNLGINYDNEGKLDSALKYYSKALSILERINDEKSIAGALINIGGVFQTKHQYPKAISYYNKGLEISTRIAHKLFMANACDNLSQVYEETGDFKNAFAYYRSARNLRDGLMNERKMAEMAIAEEKFQGEKKEQDLQIAELKIQSQQDKLKAGAQSRRLLLIALIVALIAAAGILRGFYQKKKLTANLIEKNIQVNIQKDVIQDKQNEIIKSIRYAERIQKAHLPSDKYIDKILNRRKS